MKAAVFHQFGDSSVIKTEEVQKPVINENEVLVEVYASSVNPIDFKIRRGELKMISGSKFPKIPGIDFSGKVSESRHPSFKVGDDVFGGNSKSACNAEFVKVDGNSLVKKPVNLSFEEVAILPCVAVTAYQSLVKKANLKSGMKVLINGGSGGVGISAIQIAKALGANVSTTTSKKNFDFVKQLGCDKIIDYQNEDVYSSGTYDIIFDTISNLENRKLRKMLHKNGTIVYTLPSPKIILTSLLTSFCSKKTKFIMLKNDANDLQFIAKLASSGKLKMPIDKTFMLEEVGKAHHYTENERTRGKILIKIKS